MPDYPISNVLNTIPYGFYALTSRAGDERNVMVLNWFTQTSFEPQHVVIGLDVTAYTYGLIEKGKVFGINIFHKDDVEVIKLFTKSREKNPEKFKAAQYSDGEVTGVPILDQAAAFLECEVTEKMETGSGHDVILGKIVGAGLRKELRADQTLTLPDLGWSYSG